MNSEDPKRKCTELWECPVEALNPSFGQRVLASLLNDIWTKAATMARHVLAARAGQGSVLPNLKRQVSSQMVSLEGGGLCQEEHHGGLPLEVLSSQHMEIAWLMIHAGRTGLCGQTLAGYSL